MSTKILSSFILTTCIFCSCCAQKDQWKEIPPLEIKIIHEWEQLINETSIKSSTVDMHTKEVDRRVYKQNRNSFILHYKIATVVCKVILFEDSGKIKNEFKRYSLLYNKKGNLIETDEGSYRVFYYYNEEEGAVDSTETEVYAMGGEVGCVSFPATKDIKTWDKVKGEIRWTRLMERELYSSSYHKRKKTKYLFLAKIQYAYLNSGLLTEIKTLDKKGKLKVQEKFTYTFYE